MAERISLKQLRERLGEIVEEVSNGEWFTRLYRGLPAFDIVPVANPSIESAPLELDPLYRSPPVGASESGDAAAQHDEVLYR